MTAAGSRGPAVLVRGLIKRYEGKTALDRLDLEVGTGEIRGLLGPNGAGKTTLLRALFGLIRPDAGSIELLGRRLSGRPGEPLEGVAGFVEEPSFYPYLSGRANLELLAELDEAGGTGIDDALERLELQTRARDRVSTYSTGMRQRLGIAAALLRSPQVLLLDEPTSGLDPAGARAVSELLRDLSAQGVAVVLSSHLIGEVEAICHSFTVVRSGCVVWEGPAGRVEKDAPGSVHLLHTSDDTRALELAWEHRGVEAALAVGRPGIRLVGKPDALNSYAFAISRDGLAVRRLELLVSPLETLFFSLTGNGGPPERTSDRTPAPEPTP